jgi:hypothetical protein
MNYIDSNICLGAKELMLKRILLHTTAEDRKPRTVFIPRWRGVGGGFDFQ